MQRQYWATKHICSNDLNKALIQSTSGIVFVADLSFNIWQGRRDGTQSRNGKGKFGHVGRQASRDIIEMDSS
jgi:hypothetical protein